MTNAVCLEKYAYYLQYVKKASDNTLSSYLRDIRQLTEYIESHTDETLETALRARGADDEQIRSILRAIAAKMRQS